MPNLKELYIDALNKANWLSIGEDIQLHPYQLNWLLEAGSMTKRLQGYCSLFSVNLIRQYDISKSEMTQSERMLLNDDACLAREVILLGDGVPWVAARSLIPHSTLHDSENGIATLGATPLGQRIFASENARRDEIKMAFVNFNQRRLLARRSRLWINNKPLLVAELFLVSSPIYFF